MAASTGGTPSLVTPTPPPAVGASGVTSGGASPLVLYEQKSTNRRRGNLGRPTKQHTHSEVFEEDEGAREGTDLFQGMGLSRNEMAFNKWLEKNVDLSDINFSNIAKLEVKPKVGHYINPEQLKMLQIYFNMCYLSTASAIDPEVKDQYELYCRRYEANTPYEIATVIYGKTKAREALKKEEEYYQNISTNTNIKELLKKKPPSASASRSGTS